MCLFASLNTYCTVKVKSLTQPIQIIDDSAESSSVILIFVPVQSLWRPNVTRVSRMTHRADKINTVIEKIKRLLSSSAGQNMSEFSQ